VKTSKTESTWLGLLFCGTGLLCGGCANFTTRAAYPDTWSPVAVAQEVKCPRLAGRYTNSGEVAPDTKQPFCNGSFRGEWCGETALSRDIADIVSGDWVELRQPDEDTLLVISSDPAIAVKELHQKQGDFSCIGESLERQLHVSMMSIGDNSKETSVLHAANNGATTAFSALLGIGGVRTLTRRFSVAADNSLIMAVSQSEAGAFLLVPFHERHETFVRWSPAAAPPAGDAAPTAVVATAIAPVADLPSAHVGIFDPTNGAMKPKVWVTSLDGVSVSSQAGDKGVPIALQPGRHWVEIGLLTHPWIKHGKASWILFVDVHTVYAFELEAVAGHRYRVPTQPLTCLAGGDVEAARVSANIYHSRLSITDTAPDMAERSFEVETLCASGKTSVCDPSDAPTDSLEDGLSCVRIAGGSRGYLGKDAGPVPPQ
jgi:hypothetical protein